MGMYTSFIYDADLRKDTPRQVIDVLEYMLDNDKAPPLLPAAPLFRTERWDVMLRMTYAGESDERSSLKLDANTEKYRLTARCALKNYGCEIEKFVEWIDPWVDAAPKTTLGSSQYEECDYPTPIFKGE